MDMCVEVDGIEVCVEVCGIEMCVEVCGIEYRVAGEVPATLRSSLRRGASASWSTASMSATRRRRNREGGCVRKACGRAEGRGGARGSGAPRGSSATPSTKAEAERMARSLNRPRRSWTRLRRRDEGEAVVEGEAAVDDERLAADHVAEREGAEAVVREGVQRVVVRGVLALRAGRAARARGRESSRHRDRITAGSRRRTLGREGGSLGIGIPPPIRAPATGFRKGTLASTGERDCAVHRPRLGRSVRPDGRGAPSIVQGFNAASDQTDRAPVVLRP
eukprot:gene10705-biopygen5557